MIAKRFAILLLAAAPFLNSVRAQVGLSATGAQDSVTAKALPFTDQLRKTVAFLRVGFLKNGRVWESSGTGFFVFYPDERLGKDRGFTYLVTNRHMATPGAEEGQAYAVQYFYVRLNVEKKQPGAEGPESVEIPFTYPGDPWVRPVDPSVDLAVLLVNLEPLSVDYRSIPVSAIATKEMIEAQQITVGDQVLFAGYFYQFPGEKRIEPIVRQGVLAMIPDEQISTTLQKPGNVYLADIHAFHGNSGSPLFVGGIRVGGSTFSQFRLLGVVSGYYPESETNFSIPAARVLTGEVRDNSGITAVVPGYELR